MVRIFYVIYMDQPELLYDLVQDLKRELDELKRLAAEWKGSVEDNKQRQMLIEEIRESRQHVLEAIARIDNKRLKLGSAAPPIDELEEELREEAKRELEETAELAREE